MNMSSRHRNTYRLLPLVAAVWLALPPAAAAQDGVIPSVITNGRLYTPDDFARFTPRNALDMLERVPGFAVNNDNDQGRGLGQASTNVLINGQRLSSKSQNVFDQLRRVTAEQVDRIEIVDGATLDLPGLSGQVANIITRYGDVSGQYEYRTVHRPKYAEPSWFGGEISTSGSTPTLEWNAAYSHGNGRGAAGGPGIIRDASGMQTELRDVRIQFNGEFPRLSGSVKWNGPNDLVANLNAQYSRSFTDFSNDEDRDVFNAVGQFRDFDNDSEGAGYEFGGDVEFGLGPGTLKLIGLARADENDFGQESALIRYDDSPTTGNRFRGQSETSEEIARAEYRWDLWGGNWEVDLEAAFNSFEQSSRLFNLEPDGTYRETPLPNASGEVTEDRYEMILSHGRTLVDGLTLQLAVGAENSTLAQTGPGGLTREFWRPKGSLALAWTPREGLDLSLNIARRVSQLSFGDFLASVSLAFDNENAGNVQLKPTLTWETSFQAKQNWGDWGSTTLRLYDRRLDDYIDIIPIPGGGESSGNIDDARLFGATLNATVNLDPMGWEGVRLDINATVEESRVEDPLTGHQRAFSNFYDRQGNISLRHDVPGTEWAWGLGLRYNHVLPGYRLSQIQREYEGPTYTWAFIEHKDVFGLTVNLEVFNLTDGRAILERTVYDGFRDTGAVLFHERRDLSVQPIFRLQFTGNF